MPNDKLRIAEEVYGPALKEQAAIRQTQEAKTWKDLAQAAHRKQLASKERPPRRTASQKLTTTRQGSRLTER